MQIPDARLGNKHVARKPLRKPETKCRHVAGVTSQLRGCYIPGAYKNDCRLLGDEKWIRDLREYKCEGAHVPTMILKCGNKIFLTIE